ncbi:Bacteriocin [Nostoc sp. DSM 114161]|jgi:hypothetical protein|uniref:hypothetical protein n=1 Tax=Nostoc sp. DSM 114161 TaxID=3440143 RepID=UPI00404628D1
MLQILDLENNELFSKISSEESASVSGCEVAPYAFGAAALTAGLFAGLLAFGVSSLMSEMAKPTAGNISEL